MKATDSPSDPDRC